MTAPPGNLADRPTHDLLSELLRSVRLNGERIVEYAPPQPFSIGFAGVGGLHIIEEGGFVLRLDAERRVERVSRGDVVLLPRGDAHHISSAAAEDAPGPAADISPTAIPATSFTPATPPPVTSPPVTSPPVTRAPEPARWLCGTFAIGDPQASHLLGSLPAVIILRGDRGPALEGLDVARRMLLVELHSPSQGSAVMVARILDLIFIQILRAWAASADPEPNWLAGALDPQIGPALSAIHRDPGRDWTVEELARACCLSRSAFAARFVDRVGKPPATYLAHVRLDAAIDLLRDTGRPVALIAQSVGYTSEAAFSRAFKNRYGTPPARWRRSLRRA